MRKKILCILIFCVGIVSMKAQQNTYQTGVRGVCGMCKDRIEETALKVKGVLSAEYSIQEQSLTVETNIKFKPNKLHNAIAQVGHTTDLKEADAKAYENLPGCCKWKTVEVHGIEENPENENAEAFPKIYETGVKGVCGMCKDRIESTALKVKGVMTADYDIMGQTLSVEINSKFNVEELHTAISAAGHTTDEKQADEEAYHNLPDCCKYETVSVHGLPEQHHEDHEETNVASGEGNFLFEVEDNQTYGVVYELTNSGKEQPLIGATVRWKNSNIGVVTDEDGFFSIREFVEGDTLIVSYVGYQEQTIKMGNEKAVKVTMASNYVMDEVGITAKKKTSAYSYLSTIQTLNIDEGELLKAACCNLAESFVTTASIDNTVSDAITGTRKIEMLGLAGPYVLMTRENIPDARGLATLNGLGYIPGPWIESIQINQGVASVVNGYEGLTGQINVEEKKPDGNQKFMAHVFLNQGSRAEMNVISNHKIKNNLSSGISFHASNLSIANDRNGDGFTDMPLMNNLILGNRWKWNSSNWRGQFGAKIVSAERKAGQVAGLKEQGNSDPYWTSNQDDKRIEFFNKAGYIFPNRKSASIGTQFHFNLQRSENKFNNRTYDASQSNIYGNVLFQDNLKETEHKYKVGASFNFDGINELVNLNFLDETMFSRNEWSGGIFGETTFHPSDLWSIVAALRADYNNYYGFFLTPRAHLRYAPNDRTVFRLVGGRGQRTANIFTEQIGYFASDRGFFIQTQNGALPYGLEPEISWNMGGSWNQEFYTGMKAHTILISAYRTVFRNQVVVDIDAGFEVNIYNLQNGSYANNIEIQYETSPIRNLNLRIAYRYNEAKTDFQSIGLDFRPLVSPHRAFTSLSYELPQDLNVDFTVNWNSSARIPSYVDNELTNGISSASPDYFLAYAHISKTWNKKWEVFIGAENLFNFRQENAILGINDPFETFDASMVWGPIFGRTIYLGGRYTLQQ